MLVVGRHEDRHRHVRRADGADDVETGPAGHLHVKEGRGRTLRLDRGRWAAAPTKAFQTLVGSAPWLVRGASGRLYRGGTVGGDAAGMIFDGGTYSGGTLLETATLSATTMTIPC